MIVGRNQRNDIENHRCFDAIQPVQEEAQTGLIRKKKERRKKAKKKKAGRCSGGRPAGQGAVHHLNFIGHHDAIP